MPKKKARKGTKGCLLAAAFVLLAGSAYAQQIGPVPGITSNAAPTSGTTSVPNGGTGATSLTDHGLLIGSGTAAVSVMAVCDSNKPVVGATGADPVCSAVTLPATGTVGGLFTGTATATGAEVTAESCADDATPITVTGAAVGDACFVGTPAAGPGTNIAASCFIASADTATLRFCNVDDANQTPTAGTYRATVIH
jgi:hypothetical protein